MRSRSILILVISFIALASAYGVLSSAESVERGKYRLYKFEAPIGEETYEIRSAENSLVLSDKFLFTDRGSAVPLDTTFRASADLTPISFATNGKSSRISPIDSAVEINGGMAKIGQTKLARESAAPKTFFTISGYSPMAQQMLMLRYRLRHGSPALLPILPQGTNVQIVRRGTEKVTVAGKQLTLARYSVSGLIWGSEVLWLDSARHLVTAVTTDAEFDHFEATAEGYESLLPKFVAEAAVDGMGILLELSRGLCVNQVGPLAIVGATLIDGTGSPAVPDSVVVVNNGRIATAGPRRGACTCRWHGSFRRQG